MYRIRFHGRGGQGVKTAGRILGTAFFLEGFEVQDAPRYGAERRGAPILAYVRAAHSPIHERGAIERPDLVVVVDESLLPLPPAGVFQGATEDTVLLVHGSDDPSRATPSRAIPGQPAPRVIRMPELGEAATEGGWPLIAAATAGAAARLTGVISREALGKALELELAGLEKRIRALNKELALTAFNDLTEHAGTVQEAAEEDITDGYEAGWIDIPLEDAVHAVPTIFRGRTSLLSRTGLWRSERPVIDYEACKRCWWVCATFCPEGVIAVNGAGEPGIDYDYCKGCMICLEQCPSHAIEAVREKVAVALEQGGRA